MPTVVWAQQLLTKNIAGRAPRSACEGAAVIMRPFPNVSPGPGANGQPYGAWNCPQNSGDSMNKKVTSRTKISIAVSVALGAGLMGAGFAPVALAQQTGEVPRVEGTGE